MQYFIQSKFLVMLNFILFKLQNGFGIYFVITYYIFYIHMTNPKQPSTY